jgi:1-acylglycerone phosphate reductase
MECKPLNIDVMLVAPAAVKSNLAANQASSFSLPPDSLYTDYLQNMIMRMNASQGMNSMPTHVFATKVVKRVLAKNPPRYFSAGGGSTLFALLKWLPRSWMLWYMWQLFSSKQS